MWFESSFRIPAVAAISFCLIGGTSPALTDIINVPGEQATIQAGIDAAVNGDEVVVANGQAGLGGGPVDLATGPDQNADAYLRIGSDAYGSWTDTTFGGLGDTFNPVGALPAAPATFASAFSIYGPVQGEKLLLSTVAVYQDVCGEDGTMTSRIISSGDPFDTNGDGVPDTRVSAFDVTSQSGMDISFELTQHVETVTPLGSDPVGFAYGKIKWEFAMTNNGPAWDFILQRHQDFDLVWVGDFTDDSVGTGTNGSKADRFVYQGEAGDPSTHITLSSPQGDVYYGGKGGLLPDPGDPKCVPYGFGTDVQICENFGTPGCWQNHIAGVGYDTDGDSGSSPAGCGPGGGPCDGFIGMEIPISLAREGVVKVSVMLTYGSKTPGGGPHACAWDLDGNRDVGIGDLLLLLGNWGNPYGVGDLLALLANWGPCP